jgi:hypothetical protein
LVLPNGVWIWAWATVAPPNSSASENPRQLVVWVGIAAGFLENKYESINVLLKGVINKERGTLVRGFKGKGTCMKAEAGHMQLPIGNSIQN